MKLQKKKKEKKKKKGVVFLRSKEKPGMEIELRILVPNKGAIVWFRGTHHLFLLCFSIVYIWLAEIWNSVLILEVESHGIEALSLGRLGSVVVMVNIVFWSGLRLAAKQSPKLSLGWNWALDCLSWAQNPLITFLNRPKSRLHLHGSVA